MEILNSDLIQLRGQFLLFNWKHTKNYAYWFWLLFFICYSDYLACLDSY